MPATATYVRGEVEGQRLRATAPSGGVVVNQVVVIRSGATGMIGVAITAASAGEEYTVAITGVWRITKNTTTSAGVFSQGDVVYLDVADANVSSQASANIKAGIAAAAAAAAETTADVLLIPSKA
ncbi:DUF2190 family protein [Planctomycetales bacterium ZRK34]|nr:DUF2190 family protein [Planctomycetales bacterium ZRK34]